LTELVPDVSEQASILLEEYQVAAYSPHQVDFSRAKLAASELRAVGYRSWLHRGRLSKTA
jgi:hypothetical protein